MAGPGMGGGGMGGHQGGPGTQGWGDSPAMLGGPASAGPQGQPTPSLAWEGGMSPSPSLSGTGQTPQPAPPTPAPAAQPPNAVSNHVPSLAMGTKAPMAPSAAPKPAAPPVAQPPAGFQNKMTVHNPTGIGAQGASEMAAVQRPIPANYPKKAQGQMTPMPAPTPGAKA